MKPIGRARALPYAAALLVAMLSFEYVHVAEVKLCGTSSLINSCGYDYRVHCRLRRVCCYSCACHG
jgi:hypothetical protein